MKKYHPKNLTNFLKVKDVYLHLKHNNLPINISYISQITNIHIQTTNRYIKYLKQEMDNEKEKNT